MFNTTHNECVSLESTWKVKKVTTSAATQTTEVSTADAGSSASERQTGATQTEDLKPIAGETDMPKLAEWLRKIYPQVDIQLDNTSKLNRIFDNYQLTKPNNVEADINLLQTLEAPKEGAKVVRGLHWNKSGQYLAVAYGFDHTTWCDHSDGAVCVYSLNKEDKLIEKPKRKFLVTSCVTNLRFHLERSNLLAASNCSGHIYVWNVEDEVGSLICRIMGHDQYIMELSWVEDKRKNCFLATTGMDGLLKTWNLDFKGLEPVLKPFTIYEMRTPVLGKINASTEISKEILDLGALSITCFDFNAHCSDIFVVGLERGLLVQCSALGAIKIRVNNENVPVYDAAVKYYEPPKTGDVIKVKFSPNHKDMFLTLNTNGEIKIYILDQDEPARVIFPEHLITDISFVLYQEKLLVGCGRSGKLQIYNLATGHRVPVLKNFNGDPLPCLAVNSFKQGFVAASTTTGKVLLWHFPWHSIQGSGNSV